MVTLSQEHWRFMQIGLRYGATLTDSGTIEEMYAARDLGMQIEARLQAVGGNTGWSLNELEYAEKPNAIPQMPTISVNNISDNSASVNWFTGTQYTNKPQITSFHFVLKNIDSSQTITEDNFMSGQMNSYVTNLESGTNYKGYLIAVNAIGNSTENSIGFKTTGIKVEPVVTAPVVTAPVVTAPVVTAPVITLSAEVQAILTKFDNGDYLIPFGVNTGIDLVKSGSITNDLFLITFNNLLLPDPNVPNKKIIIDKTLVVTPVEKEYDVNTYRINEFGGTFNQIIKGITGTRMAELEKEFLTTLVGRPTPSDQEIYDYYNYDISVPYGSIIQEIGDFTLENNIVKGRIDYKITEKWNSYYYDKPITSKVSMFNTETGVEIRIGNDNTVSGKENILNFTASERDEWTDINENVGDIKAVTIKFYVWKAATATFNPEAFAVPTETSIVAKEIGLKPCPINQHRDFNNKCVPNNKSVSDKPTVIALLGGVTALIGTLALLGSKRS